MGGRSRLIETAWVWETSDVSAGLAPRGFQGTLGGCHKDTLFVFLGTRDGLTTRPTCSIQGALMESVINWVSSPDRAIFLLTELLLLIVLVRGLYWHFASSTRRQREAVRRFVIRAWGRLWYLVTWPKRVARRLWRWLKKQIRKLRRPGTQRDPRIFSASGQAMVRCTGSAIGRVKRGPQSWAKLYGFLSLALAVYTVLPAVVDVGAAVRASALTFNVLSLAYLCLLNGWFQNKLIRWLSQNEAKAR